MPFEFQALRSTREFILVAGGKALIRVLKYQR